MKAIKNFIKWSVLIVCLVLAITIIVRTLAPSVVRSDIATAPDINLDTLKSAERLAGALRFETVSKAGQPASSVTFKAMHHYLMGNFPLVHKTLRREVINDHSLLYTWPGSDPDLKPILLMAHMDVVPVATQTREKWSHGPFSGEIAAGYIWGRGALDMKQGVLAILEAVEFLLGENAAPSRTLYLAFGHDEEIGGYQGAAMIAETLRRRNVELSFSLDEGSALVEGIVPGIDVPVALIGLAEKGFLTLELSVEGQGGHSSMPPASTAVGRLARAVHRLEQNQMPARLDSPARDMFRYLAPEMPFYQRAVIQNLWLLQPLLLSQLTAAPETNALIRTTTAVTVFHAGTVYNVLPQKAQATATFRILPGDTIEKVMNQVQETIDDPAVKVQLTGSGTSEPSPVSSTNAIGFQQLYTTIAQVFPGVVIAPSLVVTSTDSGHYSDLVEDSYRFLPMRIGKGDIQRIHGIDERISVENYAEIIRFYIQLLRNIDPP